MFFEESSFAYTLLIVSKAPFVIAYTPFPLAPLIAEIELIKTTDEFLFIFFFFNN